ncbi:MAG: DUF559 domain-containing protein, partial [Candidatus Marinimicrobia bacterium]|nr:DUF559 domain-containing protein [Candidatus Neomarinimicrobiota bacterium]MBL7031354.1 DUF559 domain-containing protein [Candidatus Neomarinimicrobiota bacterium]
IVEIDGGQHYEKEISKKDEERSDELQKHGLKVIRFNNHEVFTNIEGVMESIGQKVDELKEKYGID